MCSLTVRMECLGSHWHITHAYTRMHVCMHTNTNGHQNITLVHSWWKGWRVLFLVASHWSILNIKKAKQQFYIQQVNFKCIQLCDISQYKIWQLVQCMLCPAGGLYEPTEVIVSDAFCGRRWMEVKGCWWRAARTLWWMLIRGWCT